MLEKFTKELCDLYVKQSLKLQISLSIMMEKPGLKKGTIQKTAKYLYEALDDGKTLSNAMKTCPYLNFDKTYVSFVALAERTGDLKETLSYLEKKCTREKENREKLCSTMVYPVFVICLTFFLCYFLCDYANFENENFVYVMFFALVVFSFSVVGIFMRILSDNRLYEAFLAVSFLIKSGCSVTLALDCALPIVGEDTKLGQIFEEAKERIEMGMDYRNAFCFKGRFREAFYYADKAGNKNDVFEKLAMWIGEKDAKRKNLCLLLVEPLFMAITGAFLLFMVIYFFLPIMSDVSWI